MPLIDEEKKKKREHPTKGMSIRQGINSALYQRYKNNQALQGKDALPPEEWAKRRREGR